MKDKLIRKMLYGISSAVSMVLLLYGLVSAGVALMIGYMAWAGSVPVWHPLVVLAVSLASLTASHVLP